MSRDVEVLVVEKCVFEPERLKRILEQHDYKVSVKNGSFVVSAAPERKAAEKKFKESRDWLRAIFDDLSNDKSSARRGGKPVPPAARRERKLAERKIRESREWLRAILDASRDGIMVEDNGKIVFINDSYARMLGYDSSEELFDIDTAEILSPEDVGRMTGFGESRLRGESSPFVYEFKGRRKDGSHVELETSVSTSLIGGKTYIISSVREIGERKRAEQAIAESEARLRQSQKMEAIGTLTGGVAHDFNNLLTAILGNTQLVLRNLSPGDAVYPRLIEIERAGNRAAVLTRQLLAFSRRQHLERKVINLNDSVCEITKLLERIIGEDIDISVKCPDDLRTVFADAAQIEQVIMNLAVNARDAMPRGGKLTIETNNVELDKSYCRQYPYVQPGKYVQIRVCDDGCGMDEETKARIFEPFFTTKEIGKGTGLGLSMAYGIVKQHDGHINVYSEVGYGTSFKVYLPVYEQSVEAETQLAPFSSCGGSETILVAEDEQELRDVAKDVLEASGYTVLLAKNGEEAVKLYNENCERIDLLLFDVVMPRMGGAEAFEQIRDLGGDLPVIFMTGYSSETVQNRFVKQNALFVGNTSAVIQKPYSIEAIECKIREVLNEHSK